MTDDGITEARLPLKIKSVLAYLNVHYYKYKHIGARTSISKSDTFVSISGRTRSKSQILDENTESSANSEKTRNRNEYWSANFILKIFFKFFGKKPLQLTQK